MPVWKIRLERDQSCEDDMAQERVRGRRWKQERELGYMHSVYEGCMHNRHREVRVQAYGELLHDVSDLRVLFGDVCECANVQRCGEANSGLYRR